MEITLNGNVIGFLIVNRYAWLTRPYRVIGLTPERNTPFFKFP